MQMTKPTSYIHVPITPNNRSRDQATVDHGILIDSKYLVMLLRTLRDPGTFLFSFLTASKTTASLFAAW